MKTYRPVILLLMVVAIAIGGFVVYWQHRPHSVVLTWNASVGATSYNIYRKEPDGMYYRIGSSQTNRYLDKPVANGAVYFYSVKAVKDGLESGFSNEIRVEIP